MAELRHYGRARVARATEPFVLLEENRFAYAAVHRLSADRVRDVCPLVYIHGGAGAGKSHLARQFLGTAQRRNLTGRVTYLTAHNLADELTQLRNTDLNDQLSFKSYGVEILVFDDLAKIDGQRDLQCQLVALLDAIQHAHGRCLITSRKPLGEFRAILPRLSNRCRAGACVGIRTPGIESRSELIRHFAQRQQIPLSAKVVEFLAQALPLSPGDLQQAVIRLERKARSGQRSIDVEFARLSLNLVPSGDSVTLPRIAQAVARQFGISVSDLSAHCRRREQHLPRQCAMLLARELTDQSLRHIAEYFGRRNHKSVLYACRRLNETLFHDPQLQQHLAHIRKTLDPSTMEFC